MEYRNKQGLHKIAIVGTGALFPGAVSTREFWLNILDEKDFIKDVPETHWLKEDYYDPANKTGDKVYCKKGAFLDDIDFDPVEFGMPPNLLSTTDTLQLLSLVVARDTLNDTVSYANGKADKKRISVILGVAGGTELIGEMSARIHTPEWVMAMRNQGLPESTIEAIKDDVDKCYAKWNENTFPGLLGNVVSGRIANRFDLKGTNCVLDAACASSLAAIKMAVQELQLGSTDMVLSGGSDALNDIFMFMCFSKTTALSPTEDCRPFSESGDGTVLGEGVAMMTLKRLEDAERDGDRIYAVISSVGSSSDGKSGSIYAPDSNGQSLAIKRAYEGAGFSQNEIELVEAHGTGTMAGDYSEFNGLKLGYGETEKKQYCAIGSVKSMIGHTKSAAGAASLLKAAMALNNSILPPTIKVTRPNPRLDIENSPFYLNTAGRPWVHESGTSRKAGVSSMGFGGTNFHVAMEEYKNAELRAKRAYKPGKELLLISGKSQAEIMKGLTGLVSDVQKGRLLQVVKNSQEKFVASDPCRLAIVGEGTEEIIKWCEYAKSQLTKNASKIEVAGSVYYSEGNTASKIGYLFSGQGSQYLNMGSDLLMQFDEALAPWNNVCSMKLDGEKRLNDVVYPIPVFSDKERSAQADVLLDTRRAQPAIGVLALSHLSLLKKLNVEPSAVGGHSYGELAALYAAGVITTERDLVNISRKRGELMAAAAGGQVGSMTAVLAPLKVVEEALKKSAAKVEIANINSPVQTVITGLLSEVEHAEADLEKAGLKFQRLNVSTAFHSTLVASSAGEFEQYLKGVKFGKPSVPVYANLTGDVYPRKADCAQILSAQLASPVKFEQQVVAMYEQGINVFVEVGPGRVLSKFVKDILHDKPHTAISVDGGKKMNSKDAFWMAMGQLSVAGVPLAFGQVWDGLDIGAEKINVKPASAATVKINGANYGKPYPPPGGFKSLPKPNPEIVQISKSVPLANEAPKEKVSVTVAPQIPETTTNTIAGTPVRKSVNKSHFEQNDTMKEVNDQWLAAFNEIQKNTLEAQRRFQETLAASHKLFLETSQAAFQQLGGLSGGSSNIDSGHAIARVPRESFVQERPAVRQPQPAVSSVYTKEEARVSQVVSVPVVQPKEEMSQPKATQAIDFKDMLLTVVAEKTGYPKEILDLNIDLESGLGIDSIKRVEILSALQDVFPGLKNVATARLATMNTLAEILAFSVESTGESMQISNTTASSSVPVADQPGKDFKDTMLEIVSEKTGYPKEILDLSTDLESGLGIDSIKRVEILSALQEVFPELKNVDRAKLAAMNTLGEILSYSNASDDSASNETVGYTAEFEDAMLTIVAEKTGYPKEILDLDLDLESGLGIDSIKRVEILSALQDKFPALKGAETARLAALSTLGEILKFSREMMPSASAIAGEPQKKKYSKSPDIFRYIVSKVPISDNGFGRLGWRKADPLYLLKDDAGIAKELKKLFDGIDIKASIVGSLPEGATHVVNLRGLNQFKDQTAEQVLAINRDAFSIAKECGKIMFEKGGCLILPFDNGLANSANYLRAWSGGISALAKTAKLEWQNADVQSINIECAGMSPKVIAAELFNAITSGGLVTEIEIDAAGNAFQLIANVAEIESKTRGFKDGDAIIVSGGARGVTAACLIALAERMKLKIGILGRTKLEDEPAYLNSCKTDAELKSTIVKHATGEGKTITPAEVSKIAAKVLGNREVTENIKMLTRSGSTVKYVSADISNKTEVVAAVNDLKQEFGAIHGIIHAAGVLADKFIHEKTIEQFNKVFDTKILGFINLLDATESDKLTHICCFSSVAARMGNRGQVDYAMANEVLNKICQAEQKKRGESCLVKSLNWGPWDGGMVSPQLKNHFASMGIDLIPLQTGAEMFADEMEDGSIENVEIVIGGSFNNWNTQDDDTKNVHTMWVHQSNNPFLNDHVIEGRVVVPMMMANEWCMRLAQSLFPALKVSHVAQMKVLKGIQLENFEKDGDVLYFVYTVEKEEQGANVKIKIQNEAGQLHYSVTVQLSDKLATTRQRLSSLKDLQPWSWDKSRIYNAQLFHGPDFQVVEQLKGISAKGCEGLLKIANPVLLEDSWISDMFLLDGGMQMANLAMAKWTDNTSALPMGFEKLIIYDQIIPANEMKCELILKKRNLRDSEWDINFKDSNEQLLAEMTGVRMYLYRAN